MPPTIILVQPQLPENIGAVCRAMSNFGLDALWLIAPQCDYLDERVHTLAKHASFIVKHAQATDTLETALTHHSFAFGFTRRAGRTRALTGPFHECLRTFATHTPNSLDSVALVFGPEESGLSNEDAALCDALVTLPTTPNMGSMNLSHAVSCACYELARSNHLSSANHSKQPVEIERYRDNRQRVQDALVQFLEEKDFFFGDPKEIVLQKLQHAIRRSLLTESDLHYLQKAIQKLRHLDKQNQPD
jgi:tRNA/rRNA methyltransferase